MTYDRHLITLSWKDYELLDSGDNMKLERFGEVILARPETQALWKRRVPELWDDANAFFSFSAKKGSWDVRKAFPQEWIVSWRDVKAEAKLTAFKHTGIFPEQEPNWKWIEGRVKQMKEPRILNLFGYTGVATLVSATNGATVTHVDASKQSIDWARKNATISELEDAPIRWLADDALAFVKREVRRGNTYDGIILDPPAFGRGAKGEVWHIEKDLPELLTSLKELLNKDSGSFFLLNGYASGYSPRSFGHVVESIFGDVRGECGELHIAETGSKRAISAGIYVRFVM